MAVDPGVIVAGRGGSRDRGARPLSGQRVDASAIASACSRRRSTSTRGTASALGMQDVARRAGRRHRHRLPALPVPRRADRGDRAPVLRAGARCSRARCATRSPRSDRFAAFVRGFARVLADHGVHGHCTWDAPAAEPVRAELRDADRRVRRVGQAQAHAAPRPDGRGRVRAAVDDRRARRGGRAKPDLAAPPRSRARQPAWQAASQPARAGDRSCAVGPVRALDPGQLGRVAATRRSTRRRSRRSARPARAPPRAGSGG